MLRDLNCKRFSLNLKVGESLLLNWRFGFQLEFIARSAEDLLDARVKLAGVFVIIIHIFLYVNLHFY